MTSKLIWEISMKKVLLMITSLVFITSAIAKDLPNVTCFGSHSAGGNVEHVELKFRDGAAAFSDVYFGELDQLTFIVILNKALPINDLEALPVTMGIYQTESGKTYVETEALLFATGMTKLVYAKTSTGLARLSCVRKVSFF